MRMNIFLFLLHKKHTRLVYLRIRVTYKEFLIELYDNL